MYPANVQMEYDRILKEIDRLLFDWQQQGSAEMDTDVRNSLEQLVDDRVRTEKEYGFHNNPLEAIQYAEEIGLTNPLTIYYRKGVIFNQRLNTKEAIRQFEQFLRRIELRSDDEMYVHYRQRTLAYLARCYWETGQIDHSLRCIQQVRVEANADGKATQILEGLERDMALINRHPVSPGTVPYIVSSTQQNASPLPLHAYAQIRDLGFQQFNIFMDTISKRTYIKQEEVQLPPKREKLLFHILKLSRPTAENLFHALYTASEDISALYRLISNLNRKDLRPHGILLESDTTRSETGVYRFCPGTTTWCLLYNDASVRR